MSSENLPNDQSVDLEEDSPGRGCGTHMFRAAISKLPLLEDRIAMADLLGDPLHLCQPLDFQHVIDVASGPTHDGEK